MKKLLALLGCVVVLAAGCYVAGLKASYQTEEEQAAIELEQGRLEYPADTPLATR